MNRKTARYRHVCKLLGMIFLLSFAFQGIAAELGDVMDDKVTKSVERSFKIPETRNFSITNKYGPIIINNWNKDSIRVEIEITAYGKNYSNARKTLNRVDIDFDQSRQYLNVSTILDRSSGFFTELWNSIGDYSKTLLSQNRLEVQYKVYIPNNLNLSLTNKFGDIYIEDYIGRCSIDISYGNIMAQKFLNRCEMTVGYGTVTIKELKDGILDLKTSDVRIDKITSAEIKSTASEIEIIDSRLLRMESRNDREYRIRNAVSIIGQSDFSRLEVDNIIEDINLETSYGGIELKNIDPQFSRISLRSKTTDVKLIVEPGSSFHFRIEGKRDKVQLPDAFYEKGKVYSDDDQEIALEGDITGGSSSPGEIDIRNQNGEIQIIYK